VPTAKVDAGVSAKKRVANNGGPHLTQLMAVSWIAPPGHRFAKVKWYAQRKFHVSGMA
jgi:hypothetical protein